MEFENNASISPWSDLPKELLSIIKNLLESPLDITRFRCVCSSWRSSIPPFKTIFPVSAVPFKDSKVHQLTQKIIFCIEPLIQSSSSPSFWFVGIEFDGCKMYLVNPFTGLRIETLHYKLPKHLNVCDFKFTELKMSYNVQDIRLLSNGTKRCMVKKALFVYPPYYDLKMLVVLLSPGNLSFYKLGTDQWIVWREIFGMELDDIILYHGIVYGISSLGNTVVVYSDLIPNKIAQRVFPEGKSCTSYFIESCGYIYLIEKYDKNEISGWNYHLDDCSFKIKVHRLLEEEKLWEEVRHLENRVFFISSHGNLSFSASSDEFLGCKGNCVVFEIGSGTIDERSYEVPENAGVFDVETDNIQFLDECPGYGERYWPPPNWLHPQNLYF